MKTHASVGELKKSIRNNLNRANRFIGEAELLSPSKTRDYTIIAAEQMIEAAEDNLLELELSV